MQRESLIIAAIITAAELASLGLFLAMLAVWAALGAGAI